MSSAASSSAATSSPSGSGSGDVVALLERADLPAGVDHAALVADAVVRAAPRRLGREVDAALPHDLAVGVGAALVVLAVDPHRHGDSSGRSAQLEPTVSRASRPPARAGSGSPRGSGRAPRTTPRRRRGCAAATPTGGRRSAASARARRWPRGSSRWPTPRAAGRGRPAPASSVASTSRSGPCGSGGSAQVKLSGKWNSSGGSSTSAALDHRVLEAEQHPRVDLEREVEVDGPLAALLGVEVDLPVLAQRVALDEVALVVDVEPVLDRVVLQVGHEPGDVDDCHRYCCSSRAATISRPSARVRNARPRCESACFSSAVISAKVRPSPSSGTNTGS